MNFKILFNRLGFGKNAHRVYEALLNNKKPMLISHIAQAAEVDRPEVYKNIELCIDRGFIERTMIGKRSYYVAKSPKYIHDALKKSLREIGHFVEVETKKIEKELPAHVVYFKGAIGMRAIFDDVIERAPKKSIFYRYTSERDLSAVNRYLSPEYRAKRDSKKLERLVISNPASGKAKKSRLERFIKFFPAEVDLFDQNVIQLIYADNVAFINLNTEEGYIIRDKDLARFQVVIFKQLYKKL